MKLKLVSLVCTLLILSASAFGAVTGKITGSITDADNQQPLIGVTVAVQGTSWGAVTDVDGRYTILNVPVGTYTLMITAIGYNSVELSNVQVHADLASYHDIALKPSVTELTTTISVTAETPLVIKDKTTTVNIVKAEQIQSMPTRGFEQVVGMQNSVVRMNSNVDVRQRGGRESLATGSEINLRGGRPSEVAYYVDGFSQQDPLSGLSTANISNNAIQEVAVTSGAFSAEYGHVASGIVNVVTNSGSKEYHGTVEGVTDNFGGQGFKKIYDNNYYTADFSGPVPGIEDMTFYFSGERRYLQDRAPSPVTEEVFDEFDLTNNDYNMLPNNSLSGWSYQGKVIYELSPNVKFQVNGNGSVDNWQEYRHYFNNPAHPEQVTHSPRYEDKNIGINAKLTHTLNANSFYNLSASYFKTERFRGDGVVFDDYEAYLRTDGTDTVTNPEYDVHNLFREGDGTYDSYWTNYLHRYSSYIGIKGDYTIQPNSFNTVKLGFDFQRHTVRYFENLDATLGFNSTRVNRYGYDSLGNESDSEDWMNDAKNPINLGIYLTDRFDWRGLIVNAGLRFDYFDYKALKLRSSSRPLDPDGYLLPGSGATPDQEALGLILDEGDLEDSEKFTRVSPRLGISFPISDVTQMHVNFGKFFQRPDLRRLFVGYDFYEARIDAGSFYAFPSPNLEPEKITQYEIGFNRQLGENSVFELVAYYKDVQDLTQILHVAAVPTAYDIYGNVDFGTIKGVDLSYTLRRTKNIAMNIKYSLSYATGTGSYANSGFNIAWKNSDGTPKSTNPLDYDQRHTIIGMFDVRTTKGEGPEVGGFKPLENVGFNAIVQLGSGLPYTPMSIYDAVSPNVSVSQEPTGGINSARLPWSFQIDLKVEKTFNYRNFKIVPYLWVRNLLDNENIVQVYEPTGEPDDAGYLQSEEGQLRASDPTTGAEFASRYDYGQNNPKNYGLPRMIFLGLRVSF